MPAKEKERALYRDHLEEEKTGNLKLEEGKAGRRRKKGGVCRREKRGVNLPGRREIVDRRTVYCSHREKKGKGESAPRRGGKERV